MVRGSGSKPILPKRIQTMALIGCLVVAAGLLSAVPPLQAQPAGPVETVIPQLVQIIDTSRFSPPSPDPSGIAFLPSGDLLISDGEVEEIREWFEGANVFEATTASELVDAFDVTTFTSEPAGAAVNPRNGTLFLSDDDADRVFRIHPGRDGEFGTRDDRVTSFYTGAFGSTDPEGLAFGEGALFVADGIGAEVYRVSRGRNGVFDGVPPVGDDRVRHFDTSAIGQPDVEGIEFNPDAGTLYIVSTPNGSNIAETTTTGDLLRVIDVSFLHIKHPAGLAYGPGSASPAVDDLYIAARGVDNATDPTENDGKIYEISFE